MLSEKHDQKMAKHNDDTPSAYCKRHGLKVADLVAHTQTSHQTLHNWHKYKPELFFTVVMGVKYIKYYNA